MSSSVKGGNPTKHRTERQEWGVFPLTMRGFRATLARMEMKVPEVPKVAGGPDMRGKHPHPTKDRWVPKLAVVSKVQQGGK